MVGIFQWVASWRSLGGINTISLPASLGSLGESSTSSLGVSAVCLGRSVGCLGIIAHSPGFTCLRGNSTYSLRVSAVCLGTTCLGEEALAAWEMLSSWELPAWEAEVLVAWRSALSAWEEFKLTAWELTAWEFFDGKRCWLPEQHSLPRSYLPGGQRC